MEPLHALYLYLFTIGVVFSRCGLTMGLDKEK